MDVALQEKNKEEAFCKPVTYRSVTGRERKPIEEVFLILCKTPVVLQRMSGNVILHAGTGKYWQVLKKNHACTKLLDYTTSTNWKITTNKKGSIFYCEM